ncbi:YciI family protein [Marinimicrobium locisalis]|uniref:YciI family protein n=1 Tax=Marinimicrobium locisalis TaxID=546022 RepID=UPI0032216BB2
MRYLVLAMRTPQFEPSVIDLHKEYLAQLKEDGVLELAGPFTDKCGGAYVIKVDNLEAAKTVAFDDPIHTSGSSEVTVHEWDATAFSKND